MYWASTLPRLGRCCMNVIRSKEPRWAFWIVSCADWSCDTMEGRPNQKTWLLLTFDWSVLISRIDIDVVVHPTIRRLLWEKKKSDNFYIQEIFRKPYNALQFPGMAVLVLQALNKYELICWKLAAKMIETISFLTFSNILVYS